MTYQPPFTITPEILTLVADISLSLGKLAVIQQGERALKLRKINRIKTIQASLAIEGNTLNEEQITAILDGKQVLAAPKDIQEVQGAIKAYEILDTLKPTSVKDLLEAHRVLMEGLVSTSGKFRTGGAGIMKGKEVIHVAPPAERVPLLMEDLLGWLAKTDNHPLISSSVFHYEFEFIHPFPDGNGRMGRLWQTLILSRWNPLFAYLPVETLIHDQQQEYYQAINQSSAIANSTPFITFILRMLHKAIKDNLTMSEKVSEKVSEKIIRLIGENNSVTIAELAVIIGVSTRTIERNLKILQDEGLLERIGPAKGGRWNVL
ncbi:MAG: Fic family protein [Fibrobacter sp.]|nr:Fic family protein [Fibrobacter sp.]